MDPEIKAKWIVALRSGKYAQGRGWLRTDNGFCCLGVLCDALEPNRWAGTKMASDTIIFSHDGEDGIKHDWADAGGPLDETTQETLAKMNDDGKSFAEIADYIEQNL